MVESSTPNKNGEQYPLLMVSGAGDGSARVPPPSNGGMLWTTTFAPRRPWSERWPEYLSTCWMTLILLGISFLVFYAVGMVVAYRQDAHILIKCNETQPASDVFYHKVIPRNGGLPLYDYMQYLSNVATMYRSLRFNVYFLIDDSVTKRTGLFEKLMPYNMFEESKLQNSREVKCVQRSLPNLNVTVMFLSRYMAMTPLKYKWRGIPLKYIPFYATVYSVWLNGGIGLDLDKYNYQYMPYLATGSFQRSDRKVRAILKQHNKGIYDENYKNALDKIEGEKENEMSASVYFVQRMFDEAFAIFNKSVPFFAPENDTPKILPKKSYDSSTLVRTHRNKRDVSSEETKTENTEKSTSKAALVDIVLKNNSSVGNVTGESNNKSLYQIISSELPSSQPKTVISTTSYLPNLSSGSSAPAMQVADASPNPNPVLNLPEQPFMSVPKVMPGVEENKSEIPRTIFFYDFTLFSEPFRSDDLSIEKTSSRRLPNEGQNFTTPAKFLTVDSEGSLIASTVRMHPFLSTVLTGGCRHFSPKYAIHNALISHCFGPFRDDAYCNAIYVL